MSQKEQDYFIDTSIFCGVKEFNTPLGILRAESEGSKIYSIYKHEKDNFGRSSFIFDCKIRLGKKTASNCENIYKEWLSIESEE